MAAVAPTARAETRALEARRRARPARRFQVASGVMWIVLIGVLLVGIVAVNVAVLRLNVQLDQTGRERARLRAETAALASELSSSLAAARIASRARKEQGLVPANTEEMTYVDLAR